MIGNDCKRLELNIDKFLSCFVRKEKGETVNGESFLLLRHVSKLYNLFKAIAQ